MKMVFLKLSETEAINLFCAVRNFLTGDPKEEEDFFGSPQDVNAARRAQKKIREALKTRSSRDHAPARPSPRAAFFDFPAATPARFFSNLFLR